MSHLKLNIPKLRFPEFYGQWQTMKLKDMTFRITRKNNNLETDMPLTISGNLGLISQVEYFSKSVSSKNLEKYLLILNGEFAYNKSYSNGYPFGAIKRLDRYQKGALSTLYICFAINNDQSSDFIKQYFESSKWYRAVSLISVEGARNHGLLNVAVNDFFNIELYNCSLEEQHKIGGFLRKIDYEIDLAQRTLDLLQQQKKGYMQKIFSRQLRFKDNDGNNYPEWQKTNFNYFMTKPGRLEKGIDIHKN